MVTLIVYIHGQRRNSHLWIFFPNMVHHRKPYNCRSHTPLNKQYKVLVQSDFDVDFVLLFSFVGLAEMK